MPLRQQRENALSRYTAFGSGVSTEIAPNPPRTLLVDGWYTAFGSGVSTEIEIYVLRHALL